MVGLAPARARRWSATACCVAVALGTACRGDRIAGPLHADVPPPGVAIALGLEFSCALTTTGRAYCWGDNGDAQIGDSSFLQRITPAPALTAQTFVAIDAGNATVCALDRAGTAWCWGDDPTRPGTPTSFAYTPHPILGAQPLKSLAVGRKFACGLDADGAAFCWGENGRGQLGVGDTTGKAAPTAVLGGLRFSSLAAGFFSTCGVTTVHAAYCWGDNTFGELGTGDTVSASVPRRVGGSNDFTSLSGGSIHECALTAGGAAYCWGTNISGQLGDGTAAQRLLPTAVVGGLTFASIRSHRANSIFSSTCATTTSGDVYCWGWNGSGQLGTATALTVDACTTIQPPGTTNQPGVVSTQCSYRPLKVPGLSGVTAIDAGGDHACALTSTAKLYCWGGNTSGQLGDGSGMNQTLPVMPAGGLLFP